MTPWHSLRGKTVWVTGGAGYLGTAVTGALDAAAEKTLCIDVGEKAAALVKAKGLSKTVPVEADIADTENLEALIDRLIGQHGVPDGVVHLAFASSAGKRLEELSVRDFSQTLDLTLPAAFLLCRTLGERMKPRGSGSIVLFSSMYGVVAPDPGVYPEPLTPNPIDYGASKAAILQLARYFAVHYGPSGIRVNCVTPGPFPNPSVQRSQPEFVRRLSSRTALGRVGASEEIIGPTLFLLTDSASFVTGHSLTVDGGWTIW